VRAAYFYLLRDEPQRIREVALRHAVHWRDRALAGYRGGPFADRTGGLITFDVPSRDAAERLVATDPFVSEGLVDRSWLKEWRPE
jgi:uncharacterized protein